MTKTTTPTTTAQMAERTRWAAIMAAPAAKGRGDLAAYLAGTSMTTEQAIGALEAAAGRGRFAHFKDANPAALMAWQQERGTRLAAEMILGAAPQARRPVTN